MSESFMQEGLVSTVIPVYNRPELLREAVASVLAQTYRPIEIIIVDDGSTDGTPNAINELVRESPAAVRSIRKENAGPGLAREAGRLAARGEFLQYLDSDDLLLPDKFTLQVAGLRQGPDCGVAYGWTRYRHRDGRLENGPWKGSGNEIMTMFPAMLKSRWWDTPTPLYRRSLCDTAGPWSDLRLEEDWEYDCRVASLGVQLCHVKEFVAEVRDVAPSRLCRGAARDPFRMRERTRAHALILGHAETAGIGVDTPEMRHFARELFLLCRQCGAAGLGREARCLFDLSRQAAGDKRSRGLDYRGYFTVAALLGWSLAGKMTCMFDRFRKNSAKDQGSRGTL